MYIIIPIIGGLSALASIVTLIIAVLYLIIPSKRNQANKYFVRSAVLFSLSLTFSILSAVFRDDKETQTPNSIQSEARQNQPVGTIAPVAPTEKPIQHQEKSTEPAKPPPRVAGIAPNVFNPYDRKGYPKTFATWGVEGVKRIDHYRVKAAKAAAKNERCDFVEVAELSDNRSTPPNKIVLFVDCRNGERFYISSDELDKEDKATTISQKTSSYNENQLIEHCEEATKAKIRFPSSFNRKWGTTNVYRAPQGNVVVTFDFTAKNGLGLEIPQRARCVVDDRGMHPPELSDR